ncbi:acylphosphatase [Ancylobacter lacus]|uniref:acylphosphatase n=1 Tax=Ancylobacter lacus TaxID=2579970 RepID=UPI001BCA8517|nr:acylphosphatase [Ancylobacter lacus]MBS7540865.1 acylphosphatase [Ancylobacter lacus]
MPQTHQIRLMIHGRVQGVGYRAWLAREAGRRGLAGWVRNRASGAVEALLCGQQPAVEALIAACHGGPPAARVERVDELPPGPAEEVTDGAFAVLPTL